MAAEGHGILITLTGNPHDLEEDGTFKWIISCDNDSARLHMLPDLFPLIKKSCDSQLMHFPACRCQTKSCDYHVIIAH